MTEKRQATFGRTLCLVSQRAAAGTHGYARWRAVRAPAVHRLHRIQSDRRQNSRTWESWDLANL